VIPFLDQSRRLHVLLIQLPGGGARLEGVAYFGFFGAPMRVTAVVFAWVTTRLSELDVIQGEEAPLLPDAHE